MFAQEFKDDANGSRGNEGCDSSGNDSERAEGGGDINIEYTLCMFD